MIHTQYLVLYNTKTKEVYFILPDEGEAIVKNGYHVAVYNDSEPVFDEHDGNLYLVDNKVIIWG